jgi:hypothetical protein
VDSPSSARSTSTTELPRPKLKPRPNSRAVATEKHRARAPAPPPGNSIPKGSNCTSPVARSGGERDAENEQLFWSGGKPPRIPDNSDSLLDEELDMGDMDTLMSPPPMPSSRSVPTTPGEDANDTADDTSAVGGMNTDDENDDGLSSGEPTIVVSKIRLEPASAPTPPSPPLSRLARPNSQKSAVEPQTPVQAGRVGSQTAAPPSLKTKVRRVRITAEVERISVSNALSSFSHLVSFIDACSQTKIWSTIPDLLVPGNNFNSPGKRPPDAKDTLFVCFGLVAYYSLTIFVIFSAVLQTIAAQPIPDPGSGISSPSTRSTLSSLLGIETFGPGAGSPHQIMTANVLLSLLTAPNVSLYRLYLH